MILEENKWENDDVFWDFFSGKMSKNREVSACWGKVRVNCFCGVQKNVKNAKVRVSNGEGGEKDDVF